jgi:cyclophilin family peptidyl-prolyl cis-trans isomerase
MLHRLGIVLAFSLLMATAASAQVVRFETNVGDFDMVLNPTNNPVLQAHVDNLLHYVEEERYRGNWINRAAQGFVLQMGGFYSNTKRPPSTIENTRSVFSMDPVLGEPAIETGLSNTVGTVAMALPGGASGTNQDGGTSSFFVNLGDNSGLDSDFTVFAAIPDMTVVNEIMSLMQLDLTQNPDFGVGAGNLAFIDVPQLENDHMVFIKRAFVVEDTMAITMARSGVQSVMSQSAGSFGNSSSAATFSSAAGSSSAALAVPEPGGLMLIFIGGTWLVAFRGRRRS